MCLGFMRGEYYDEVLRRLFQGDIMIQQLNQKRDQDHVEGPQLTLVMDELSRHKMLWWHCSSLKLVYF